MMLLVTDSVRDGRDRDPDVDPPSRQTLKYCRTCKCKHAKGKHTEEGRKLHKSRQQKKQAELTPTKTSEKVSGERRTRSQSRNQKCFTCGKEHFPFCKHKKKGELPTCVGCGKDHAPPFCRTSNKNMRVKKENRQAENAIARCRKGLRAKIKKAVASSLEDLFMMTKKALHSE